MLVTATIKPDAGTGFFFGKNGVCKFPTKLPDALSGLVVREQHEEMIEDLNQTLKGLIIAGNVFLYGGIICILGGPYGWVLSMSCFFASFGAKIMLGKDGRKIMAGYSDKKVTYEFTVDWFSVAIKVTVSDPDPESGAQAVDEGVKKPKPVYTFEGGHLDGSENSYWDLCAPNAGKKLPRNQYEPSLSLTRGFSFYAKIKWEEKHCCSHIFDFGHYAKSENKQTSKQAKLDPIIGFGLWSPTSKQDGPPNCSVDVGKEPRLATDIYPSSLQAIAGSHSDWLFVVDPAKNQKNQIRIYKDRQLCGRDTLSAENDGSSGGRDPFFFIGRSRGPKGMSTTNNLHENFKGSIRDIKIWDTPVEWEEGTPDVKDDDAALPKSLLTSPSVIGKSRGEESLTRNLPVMPPEAEKMSPMREKLPIGKPVPIEGSPGAIQRGKKTDVNYTE